ncbi:uncharacterized protein LOC111397256 [Olea europaea subsp. europaea]|uniref:Uncharacterized protein LOC111397256 n=1 Tax=Olea europaea subsp. europaea TaxID=158383 RepID=A0A8S0QB41_OLEEU|nr:uncharacterized protein LOC111397256 [Olea europaea subsp. europaea]
MPALIYSFDHFTFFIQSKSRVENQEGRFIVLKISMTGWLNVILVVAGSGILAVLLVLIIKRFCCKSKRRKDSVLINGDRAENLQNGIARLHQASLHHVDGDGGKKTNNYVFRRGISSGKPFFSWADYPSLVTDAVENGWSRFAFTTFTSSPSVKSAKSLLGVCATGDHGNEIAVEIGWEICEGSADFMQKIRLNPGLEKLNNSNMNSSTGAISLIRTALPLPGPHLGNSSFPQESYFEITILSSTENSLNPADDKSEDEKMKLIHEDFNAKIIPDSLTQVTSNRSQHKNRNEENKIAVKEDGKNEAILPSVGLTGGGPLPLKVPGSHPGSIGFNSTGSVHLDGIKLVYESENEDWGRADRVIGCGYNPSQKKVFFTVDSQLVHEIHCKSEGFAFPLYPTLAANTDIMVLVNLGQSIFKYAPANLLRTPNPCFIGPMANSSALGYEDSKELFSMGRIDSMYLQRSATRSNNNTVNSIKAMEYDQESEGDLFEIVLDSTGRSPHTYQ